MSWVVELSSTARRSLERIPPKAIPAVIEFIAGPLAENPYRVGKPLRGDLVGVHSARRGAYRVIYYIDEDAHQLVVTLIAHRAEAYRPR